MTPTRGALTVLVGFVAFGNFLRRLGWLCCLLLPCAAPEKGVPGSLGSRWSCICSKNGKWEQSVHALVGDDRMLGVVGG
jgi:hypothetical protein